MTKSKIRGFEVVTEYKNKNINIPTRRTKESAGYDIESAEEILIPSIWKQYVKFIEDNKFKKYQDIHKYISKKALTSEIKDIIKELQLKPTLIPTGIKAYMQKGEVLKLYIRSSSPIKKGLIMSNGVGIIDGDYYNNADNEGHIYFQVLNFLPFDIVIKKHEAIGQGIFQTYLLSDRDELNNKKTRSGGHGSTG